MYDTTQAGSLVARIDLLLDHGKTIEDMGREMNERALADLWCEDY